MKCIKSEDGVLNRVNDTQADTKVRTGEWSYVPKQEWKILVRPVIDKKVRERFPANIEGSAEFKAASDVKAPHQKKKERVAAEKTKSKRKTK